METEEKNSNKGHSSLNRTTIMFTLIAYLAGIASSLVVAYLTQKWTLEREIERRNYEKKREIYSELMGIRMIRKQLLVFHSQAQIILKYHELRVHRTKDWKESVDHEMAKVWMKETHVYNLEIAKIEQRLSELLGLVKIYFPTTTDLNEKIDRIYKVKYFQFSPPAKDMNLEQIQEWRDQTMLQAQNIIEQEYGKPLEDLIDYLTSYFRP